MLLREVQNPVRAQTMFSVDRISRQGDKFLGRLRMNAETLQLLRQDNVGLLFEKFLSLETMPGRITPLADKCDLGRIAIVYSSKDAGSYIHDMLSDTGLCERSKKPPVTWHVGNLIFTSVEALSKLVHEHEGSRLFGTWTSYRNEMRSVLEHRVKQIPTVNNRLHRMVIKCIEDTAFKHSTLKSPLNRRT